MMVGGRSVHHPRYVISRMTISHCAGFALSTRSTLSTCRCDFLEAVRRCKVDDEISPCSHHLPSVRVEKRSGRSEDELPALEGIGTDYDVIALEGWHYPFALRSAITAAATSMH